MLVNQQNNHLDDGDDFPPNINANQQLNSSIRNQLKNKCIFAGILVCLLALIIYIALLMLNDLTKQFSVPLKFFDIGSQATGVIAIGLFARGIICFGQFSFGFVCLSQLGFGLIIGIHQIGGSLGFGIFQIGLSFYIKCCQMGLGIWKVKFAMFGISILSPFFNKQDKFIVTCM